MTYLERSTEIQEKLSTHRAGIAECELEMSELILDMANHIETLRMTSENIKRKIGINELMGIDEIPG